MTEIRLHCSPDADDLFMVRALLEEAIPTTPYRFIIDTSPTDALNRLAHEPNAPDVLAISIAHYPQVAHTYQLLPHGGSMGENYGPVVVAREPCSIEDLVGRRVAIPGLSTTAWTTLQLVCDGLVPVVVPIVPMERIFESLRDETVDAALLIHEGRLTFEREGFVQVLDLGQWWFQQTDGLPLPLGGNVIRRSLGPRAVSEVSQLLRASIAHGLAHRSQAIDWLLVRGGALETPQAVSQYLGMYANDRTLDYGEDGRKAIHEFFRRTEAAGLLPPAGPIDFAP